MVTLRHILSLSGEEINDLFDKFLSDSEQKYIISIFETYRIDIIDYAIDTGKLTPPNIEGILNDIWKR